MTAQHINDLSNTGKGEPMDAGDLQNRGLDENFLRILKRASRDYLTPEELMNERLPAALTFRETWETLTALRRAGAVHVPFQEKEGFDGWYAPTLRITDMLGRLERQCCADSALTRYTREAKSSDIYAESLADEIVGIVMHDNVRLERAATAEFLVMRYAPRTDGERLLRNIYELSESLDDYRDEAFSPALIDELHARIVAGVDTAQLDLPSHADRLARLTDREHWADENQHLALMLAYANGDVGDPFDHALVRAAFLRTFFSYHNPWPSMNNTLGRFLFCLMCLKHDLPLACLVPYSSKLFAWLEATRLSQDTNGDTLISTLSGSVPSAFDAENRSSDFTAFVTLALDLLDSAVNEMAQRIERQRADHRMLESMLSGNFIANPRQRALLSRALRNPHETFLIRQHRIDQQIAYGTARSDLLELVDAGFFVQAKEGKKYVFRPSPQLAERLHDIAGILHFEDVDEP